MLAALYCAGFALAYVLLARYALMVPLADNITAAYYPAAGIGLAALLLFGRPAALVVFAGEALVQYAHGGMSPMLLVASAGETLGALGAYELLTQRGRRRFDLGSSRDLGLLVCAALLYGGLAATAGVPGMLLTGAATRAQALVSWWVWLLGDATGVLSLAPLILAWRRPPVSRYSPQSVLEAVLCGALTVLTAVITFIEMAGLVLSQPLAFPSFAVQVWASLRFGLRGATASTLAVAALAIYGTAHGAGPFAGYPPNERALVLQSYLLLHAVMGLMLSVLIYEREHAEVELRRQREYLRQVVDITPNLIFVRDRFHRFVFVNQALADLYGVQVDEMLGKTDWDFTRNPEHAAFFASIDREVLETGEERLVPEEQIVDSRGRTRWLQVVKRPLRDEFGIPRQVLGVATDITARREAEEGRRELELRMREAQRLESMGILAGGIAHDFNNLLVAMLGNADLALLDLAADNPAAASVRRIRTAALRASDLANQMLAYSGKGRFTAARIDLSQLVEEMLHLLEAAIGKSAVIRQDFAPDLPEVDGDPAQLRQVVMNLITNAADALPEGGGEIVLRTGRAAPGQDGAERVLLEVADTGCGMDAETQARMFDPFFTTKFTGRGLGMAAVLGIVRGHEGAIEIDSAPGRGTRITVLLPVASASREPVPAAAVPLPAPPAAPAPATVEDAPPATVLVVDDDPAVCSVARRALARHGFRVLEARDGARALEVFRERQPEISAVLLDLTMPEMGGDEVLRELRSLDPQVRVVLSSGFSESDVASQLGADSASAGFLQKPYEVRTLVETFQRVTAQA
jgi:PAS domain S-box-containing protein